MPPSSCVPCECPSSFWGSKDAFMQAMLVVVCQIVENTSEITVGDVVVAPPTAAAADSQGSVAVGVAAADVLAANANRIGGFLQNTTGAAIYVRYEATASTPAAADASSILVPDGSSLDFSPGGVLYTGAISVIAPAGADNIYVVEFV